MSDDDGKALTKIQTLEGMAEAAELIRADGRTIALAHGTFDLLHMGHVRHLQAAARHGDVLFVTVTCDEGVNKGPGRPVFAEQLRAEMLAALGCVECVAVNPKETAVNVIRSVKPDVYIKGSDYANPDDDITGKIRDERDAVEAYGGRIEFTDDITFSSSTLINRYLDVFDPVLREYLDRKQNDAVEEEIDRLTAEIAGYRVLIVGDSIIDEYNYVFPMGKSPKENMIATRYRDSEVFAGGVAAAANHIAEFCESVEILTAVGDDGYEDLTRNSLKPNVWLHAITRPGKPTTRKARYIDDSYMRKLFEVYHMDDTPMEGDQERRLVDEIENRAGDFDLVIVTDFGHGLITPRVIDALSRSAKFLAVNCQSNSANHGYNLITKYNRADYICIDAPEARLAVADKYADTESVVTELLPARIDCPNFVVTHGKHGCIAWKRGGKAAKVPAFTKTVVDTVGAGDAFFAVTAPMVAAGARMETAGFVGNAAGAMKVGIVGHRQSIEKVSLLKFIRTLLK
tara:strand:- start:2696 stop:4237 length:1542 start_codon:yes stop_codon:yes gene_type:complete